MPPPYRTPFSAPDILIHSSTTTHRKRRNEDITPSEPNKRRSESLASKAPEWLQEWRSKGQSDASEFPATHARLITVPSYTLGPAILVSRDLASRIRSMLCASREYKMMQEKAPKERDKLSNLRAMFMNRMECVKDRLAEPQSRVRKHGVEALTEKEWAWVDPLYEELEELKETDKRVQDSIEGYERLQIDTLQQWRKQLEKVHEVLEIVWVNAGIANAAGSIEGVTETNTLPSDVASCTSSSRISRRTQGELQTARKSPTTNPDGTKEHGEALNECTHKPRVSLHEFRAELISRTEDLQRARNQFDQWQNSYRQEYDKYGQPQGKPADDLREKFDHHYIIETSSLARRLDAAEKAYELARKRALNAGVSEANSDACRGSADFGYDDTVKFGKALVESCNTDYICSWKEKVVDARDDPNPEVPDPWSRPLIGGYTEEPVKLRPGVKSQSAEGADSMELEELFEFPSLLASGRRRKCIDEYAKQWRRGKW